MPLQIARSSAVAEQLYADFEPDTLATAHRRGIGTNVSRRAATEERKSASDLEPEGGFEPPTCRLRGHRSPATMIKADRAAQLRKAERQGRNGSVKGGTLAETLAQQSRLSGTPHQFRPSDPRSGGVLEAPAPAGALLSWENDGSRVERDGWRHPLWRVHMRLLPVGIAEGLLPQLGWGRSLEAHQGRPERN
jgi:hypothetical protein